MSTHRSHARISSALRLVVLSSLLCASACDDEAQPATADIDTAGDSDGDVDEVEVVDTTEPSDADMEPDLPPKKGPEEPCARSEECQRGLTCVLGACLSLRGCAGDLMDTDEYGCIIEDRTGGSETVVECSEDTDCAASPYGASCIRHVCTDQIACTTDAECQAPETCYETTLCLP